MIHPLRRVHRATFTVLAVVLPTLFVLGVAARAPIPAGELPTGDAAESIELGEFDAANFAHADVLVYWTERSVAPGAGLPDDARLLGVLRGGRVELRAGETAPDGGRLVLYSLAEQAIVGLVDGGGAR